jgi:hypothetical protein
VLGDHVVLLDGDCIPHPEYVGTHVRHRRRGEFLYGHRVFLGPRTTAALTPERIRRGEAWSLPRTLARAARGEAGRAYNALHLPSDLLLRATQRALRDRTPVMRGMNFSAWKGDLIAVNGWNEDYRGWGREDDDLVARLQFLGLRGRSVRFGAILFHLHHPIQSRSGLEANDRIFRDVLRAGESACRNGIRRPEAS